MFKIKDSTFRRNSLAIAVFLAGLGVLAVTIYLLAPQYGHSLNGIYKFFSTVNENEVRTFINSFGAEAPIVFLLIQIAQAVIAPLPGFVFTIAGGVAFGVVWGVILSIVGSLIGSIICFFLSKKWGRPFLEKILGIKDFGLIDDFFEDRGLLMTFILRAIPSMDFGFVSYLIGITEIDFKDYLLGTFLGLIPTTLFYTFFGYYILDNPFVSTLIGIILLILMFATPFLIYFAKKGIKNKKEKKKKFIS